MKNKILNFFLISIFSFCAGILMPSSVLAIETDSEDLDRVVEKSILTGAYQCYNDGRLISPIEYGKIGKFSDDIITNDKEDIAVISSAYDLSSWYQIWGKKQNLTCSELFTGYGQKFNAVMKDLREADFTDFRNVVVNHNDMIDSFMIGILGYNSSMQGKNNQCIELTFWTESHMISNDLGTALVLGADFVFDDAYKTTALLCNNTGDTLKSNTKLEVKTTASSLNHPIEFTSKEGSIEMDCASLTDTGLFFDWGILNFWSGNYEYNCPAIKFSDVDYSLEKLAAKIYTQIISTGNHGNYELMHLFSETYDKFRILKGSESEEFLRLAQENGQDTTNDKIATMNDGSKTGAIITGGAPVATYTLSSDSANHFISVASDMSDRSGTAFAGLKYYTKFSKSTSLKFSRIEQLVLYQWYIEHIYADQNTGIRCYNENELNKALIDGYKNEGYVEVPLYVQSKKGFHDKCLVKAKTDDNVNGINDSTSLFGNNKKSFSDLVNKIKEIASVFSSGFNESQQTAIGNAIGNFEIVDDLSEDSPIDLANMNTGIKDKADSQCDQAGSSLGWLICPLLELVANATTSMYVDSVEPLLRMDTTIFETSTPPSSMQQVDDKSALSFAWGIFQNIANIALIIFILVIVFSQLTGVGIDNYGIKKALPKLIVAAILINLSFIICQLAVDISNILGYSLRNLFEGLSTQVGLNSEFSQNGMSMAINSNSGNLAGAATLSTGALAVTGCIAAIYFGGWTVVLALIPVILGGLVTALIAILFFFILLGVRKAGVIMAVVVAPLAIVCYALPNTKKFFDKWLKLFSALLLVYPIAGLLMGAGSFTSTVLLKVGGVGSGTKDAGGFWYTLAAMLVGVVPFFLIPSLLKGAFAVLGNLGAKISGIGKSFGGKMSGNAKRWSGNAINNSEKVKTARTEHARGRQTRYAQRVIDRVNAKGDRATAQDRLRAARAQQILNRQIADDIEAEVGVSPLDRSVLISQAQLKRENADVEAMESNIMNSDDVDNLEALQRGLETAITSGDTIGIRAYQNVLSRKGEDGRQAVHNAMVNAETAAKGNGTTVSDAARRAYSSNLMNKWAGDYKNYSRSTFAYASKNTGTEADGSIESYHGSVIGGLKQEQLATMDGTELQRYADRLRSGTMPAEESSMLQGLAYDTLHNEHLQSSIKGSQRTILEGMAKGYTPASTPPEEPPVTPPSTLPKDLNIPHAQPVLKQETPHFETFDNAAAAEAALNAEIQKQRMNEKNRGSGSPPKIIP